MSTHSIFGDTPLHLAIGETITEKMIQTVRVLVSAGDSTAARDDEGKTPLDKGREINNAQILKILEDANPT
jgi:ankyrin repeat protein